MSVRQRAIDLLYAMCDHSNAQTIVGELLQYLEKADYSIRETLVRVSELCSCLRTHNSSLEGAIKLKFAPFCSP